MLRFCQLFFIVPLQWATFHGRKADEGGEGCPNVPSELVCSLINPANQLTFEYLLCVGHYAQSWDCMDKENATNAYSPETSSTTIREKDHYIQNKDTCGLALDSVNA